MTWIYDSSVQYMLLAAGILLSGVMWWMSRNRINGLFSISWRMYITAILTAGIPWFGGKDPDYILFWTMMVQDSPFESPEHMMIFFVLVVYISIYWFVYMAAFLLIRSFFKWRLGK